MIEQLKQIYLKGDFMSNITVKDIVCPKCSEATKASLYNSINVTNEPKLRSSALSGQLFKWQCSSCGHSAQLAYPVLYNDMKHRFMVYLIPQIERFQLCDVELEARFSNVEDVTKRLAPDFNTFKEKIFMLESGLDDMAIELTKLTLSDIVAKKLGLQKVEEGYLSMYNRETNTMGFTFFTGENNAPYVQSVRLEVYSKAMKIVEELAGKDKQLEGFLKIDREWASNLLYRHKRAKQLQKLGL